MAQGAFGFDMSAMLGNHFMGNGQTQSRAGILGCKEGVENLDESFLGNTLAGILENNGHPWILAGINPPEVIGDLHAEDRR